jgi:CYTH domain-containing protein
MLALEDTFYNLAISCGQKSVVLCDRGVMDTSAYMSKAAFRRMLDQVGLSDIAAKEGRYHGVIHLVTAADGAEKFYGSETNATRRENPEEAREIDQKIRAAWIGHPYLSVIDNSTSFSDKVKKVLDCVLHLVGEPTPGIAKRKFLVSFAPEELPVDFQTYDVEHDYLISTDATQQRLRRRGKNGRYTFTLTTRYSKSEDGQRVETRRVLTEKEHESLVNSQKDPERMTVKKQRRSFLYERQYFELDLYLQPKTGLLLLEGSMDPTLEPNLPPFLQVEREVTKSPEFSMFALAKLD